MGLSTAATAGIGFVLHVCPPGPGHRAKLGSFCAFAPGNADLRIGMMAEIGFVCTTGPVPKPPLGQENWVRSAQSTGPSRPVRPKLASFRTFRPPELGSFCTTVYRLPTTGYGLLGSFRTIGPRERRSPDRHSDRNWVRFAHSPFVPVATSPRASLFLAQKSRPPRATCQVHAVPAPQTAFFGAPAQNTRIPQYQNTTYAQNGILGFSCKNAISGNALGIAWVSAAGLTRPDLFPFLVFQIIIHKS